MRKVELFPQSKFLAVALYLLFVILTISSCVADIDYTEQSQSIPVVNCILTNDTIQLLSITRSVKINNSLIFREIKDAVISLYQDELKIGDFIRVSYDNWQLKYTPIAGKTYTLRVKLSDGQILSATTMMPKRVIIQQNNVIDKFPTKNFIQHTFDFPCWITIIQSDFLLQPKSRPTNKDVVIISLGTDHELADKFNIEGNMLSFLPTSDTPNYFNYIRIRPNTNYDATPFKLQAMFGFYSYISFRTASEEYDKYLKTSMQKILMRRDESDPGTWFDEMKVYSNIHNGAGIFGAYNEYFYRYNYDLP